MSHVQVVDTVAVPADLGGKPQVSSHTCMLLLRPSRRSTMHAWRPCGSPLFSPHAPLSPGGLLPLLAVQDVPHVRRRARAAQQGKQSRGRAELLQAGQCCRHLRGRPLTPRRSALLPCRRPPATTWARCSSSPPTERPERPHEALPPARVLLPNGWAQLACSSASASKLKDEMTAGRQAGRRRRYLPPILFSVTPFLQH